MVKENTSIIEDSCILEIGTKIKNMAKEHISIQIILNMLEIFIII